MKEVIELDEEDIIRAVSEYVTRDRKWSEQRSAGAVTLTIHAATSGDGPYPGTAAKVTARVERVPDNLARNGKLIKAETVW